MKKRRVFREQLVLWKLSRTMASLQTGFQTNTGMFRIFVHFSDQECDWRVY